MTQLFAIFLLSWCCSWRFKNDRHWPATVQRITHTHTHATHTQAHVRSYVILACIYARSIRIYIYTDALRSAYYVQLAFVRMAHFARAEIYIRPIDYYIHMCHAWHRCFALLYSCTLVNLWAAYTPVILRMRVSVCFVCVCVGLHASSSQFTIRIVYAALVHWQCLSAGCYTIHVCARSGPAAFQPRTRMANTFFRI